MPKSNYLKKNYFSQPLTLFTLLGLFLVFSGCNNKEELAYTYFGGNIISKLLLEAPMDLVSTTKSTAGSIIGIYFADCTNTPQ